MSPWLPGRVITGLDTRSYGLWRLGSVGQSQHIHGKSEETYESRPGFLVLATNLPSSSMLYLRKANTRRWKGYDAMR